MTSRGFTFLEVLVVLFIISLFLSLSFPAIEGFFTGEAQRDAQRLCNLLSYVNDIAIMKKDEIGLTINLDEKNVSFSEKGRLKKYHLGSLSSIATSASSIKTGRLTVLITANGLEDALKVYFSDSKEEVVVEFNPLSNRASIRK